MAAIRIGFCYDPATGAAIACSDDAGGGSGLFVPGIMTAPQLETFVPFTPTTDMSSPTTCAMCALLQKVATSIGVPPWVVMAAAAIIGFATLEHFGG